MGGTSYKAILAHMRLRLAAALARPCSQTAEAWADVMDVEAEATRILNRASSQIARAREAGGAQP